MIDVGYHQSQAGRLSSCAGDVERIRDLLAQFKSELNAYWCSSEIRFVNSEIESIRSEIKSIASTLYGIGPDIVSAAEDIRERQEEEEEEEDEEILPPGETQGTT